jgi:hypothetical protein
MQRSKLQISKQDQLTPLGKDAVGVANADALRVCFLSMEHNNITVQFADTGARVRVQFSEPAAYPKSEGMFFFEEPDASLCGEVPQDVLTYVRACVQRMQPFQAHPLRRVLEDVRTQVQRAIEDGRRREAAAAAAAAAAVASEDAADDGGEYADEYYDECMGDYPSFEQYDSQVYTAESTTCTEALTRDLEQARLQMLEPTFEQVSDTQRVSISIPVQRLKLQPSTMAAWEVLATDPVVVELRFGSCNYTAATNRPEVFVTQAGKEWRFGQQLKQMVVMLFERSWGPGGFDHHRAEVPPEFQGDIHRFVTTDAAGVAPGIGLTYDHLRGFLVYVANFVAARAATAHHYCVICDQPHVLENAMLQPSVCERMLCVYRFHNLRIGADAADRVATGGGVLDLLVAMFRHAARSNRAEAILHPYPVIADPTGGANAPPLFGTENAKNLSKLVEEVKRLPWVSDMIGTEGRGGKGVIADAIVRWVQLSNRSHIRKLPAAGLWARIKTPHQFLFLSAAPERQAAFDALKAQHGSCFAWHGSNIENWHAIMRVGLRNASGTKLQLNGAAHGAGIYLAPESSTSLGYSMSRHTPLPEQRETKPGEKPSYFDGAGSIICLALCEVIKGRQKDHGWAWTVTDETAVMTRFLFVFTSHENTQQSHNVNVSDAAVVEEIHRFIAAHS